jgi:hypothetical protein
MWVQIEPTDRPKHPHVQIIVEVGEEIPDAEQIKSMLLAAFQLIGYHLQADWIERLEEQEEE